MRSWFYHTTDHVIDFAFRRLASSSLGANIAVHILLTAVSLLRPLLRSIRAVLVYRLCATETT
jgi:hypothetical protein